MRIKTFFAQLFFVLSRRTAAFEDFELNSTKIQHSPDRQHAIPKGLQDADSDPPSPIADGPVRDSRAQTVETPGEFTGLQAEALVGIALGAGLAVFGLPTLLNWWVRALLGLIVFVSVTFIFGRFPRVPLAIFRLFTQRGAFVITTLALILVILLVAPPIVMTPGLRAILIAGGAAMLSEAGELLAPSLHRRGVQGRLSPQLVLASLAVAFLIGSIGCLVVRQVSEIGVEVTTPALGATLAGLAIRAVTVTLARSVPFGNPRNAN